MAVGGVLGFSEGRPGILNSTYGHWRRYLIDAFRPRVVLVSFSEVRLSGTGSMVEGLD